MHFFILNLEERKLLTRNDPLFTQFTLNFAYFDVEIKFVKFVLATYFKIFKKFGSIKRNFFYLIKFYINQSMFFCIFILLLHTRSDGKGTNDVHFFLL